MKNRFATLCMVMVIVMASISLGYANESVFQFRFDARKQAGQEKSVIAAKWNGLSPLTVGTDFTEVNPDLPAASVKSEAIQTYWGGGVDLSLLGGKLLGIGEISGGERLTGSIYSSRKMDAYFHKLGLRSGFGHWSYGIDYQSVGKDYAGIYKIVNGQKKDSSAYYLWLDWRFNNFDFRARLSDSLEQKSKKTLKTSQLIDIASSYKLPYFSATHIAMSYAFGRRRQFQQHANQTTNKERLNRLKATVKHQGDFFAYTLGSSFSWDKPESSHYGSNQVEEYFVTLRYSLHSKLVLSPSYRIRSRQYFSQILKSEKNSTAAKLAISYQPLKQPYRFRASINHRTKTVTGQSEKSVLQARLKLDWTIKHRSEKESQFSLSFEHKYRTHSASGVSRTAGLRLMLAWTLLSV